MKRQTIALTITMAIFICAFVFLDLSGRAPALSAAVKFAGIASCFALSMLLKPIERAQGRAVRLALLFSVLADAFLLFDLDIAVGVLLFLPAHFLHALRLRGKSAAVIWICAASLALLALPIGLPLRAALVYAVFFINAIAAAFSRRAIARVGPALALRARRGYVLFLLCDICVALYNAPGWIDWAVLRALAAPALVLIWVFYLPAQALLAASAADPRRAQP